ncbi:hypothetical protein C7441_1033 [Pseudaminobacter salicylatoxidans]|uniref:Cell pole-organizing protein PopZ n=2 Tax=Pseudaminobacter salicylatoxidans TaxID=93369 RepID=A0A316C7G1_PSESE|nr:PopZ family protein [Pseudaminobacter salicylatoxidans]PWJ85153.1 hypothetical protein C7441_1033 [Pseudaminobacter salicylatoxidans]
MAQTSSVQREPSMEEILASIRRIIEDSDSVRKGPDEATGEAADTRLDNAVIEVDAFRAELRAARATDPYKSSSLSEVQASLSDAENELAAEAALASEAVAADRQESMNPTQVEPEWSSSAAQVQASAEMQPSRPEPEAAYDDELTAALREMPLEPEESRVDQPVSAPASEQAATPEPGRPAIISEHTGRQVAAAFGELSEAFAARSRKSLDDMAAEMLRPMLQEWLDNNLPTLVERLVREEIERVARGG